MRFIFFALLVFFLGTSAMAAAPKDPEAQIDALLKSLQAAKYDGALEVFFAGSYTAQQKSMEMKAMGGQMKAAFEFYGPPHTWDVVETKSIGKDLQNIKIISKQKDEVPLFWNALFYRRHGKWEPLGIFFFDDPKKAGFW